MYRLFMAHFEGPSFEVFCRDLQEKNWLLLLTAGDGQCLGFSSIDLSLQEFQGSIETVIYSGDTIVAPEAWNSPTLAKAWIESVYHLHATHGRGELYWLLLTSGFRTYRFLPVFWKRFLPHPTEASWADLAERRQFYAQRRFGRLFDNQRWIVQLDHPHRIRKHLHDKAAPRRNDTHLARFEQWNPGHANGDELVCFTSLAPCNLTAAGRRIAQC